MTQWNHILIAYVQNVTISGPRDQLNQATAFIDGSTVYGPYNSLTESLRTFENGQLKMMTTADGRELLPASHDAKDGCNEVSMNKQGKYCFLSGMWFL